MRYFIGFDTRMPLAWKVAAASMRKNWMFGSVITEAVHLPMLIGNGIYTRETITKDGVMWDRISEAPMSTEFAISRFFIPYLCGYEGWALFCDSDFLFRKSLRSLKPLMDDKYAVMCVKHNYAPPAGAKMDGQQQTQYARKNWSSFMLINCGHKKNEFLGLKNLNSLPGRDLHRFCWLDDADIGALPEEWNWLEGHSSPSIDPAAVHFTRGTPDMDGYWNVPYADDWRRAAKEFQ